MGTQTTNVITLSNSIIGVGILAMPFCFLKCGVVLAVLLLIGSMYITRISCHFLIKSSFLTKKRNFEFLAFHAFGTSGKLMVELFVIGYLMGTCIAYYVVVGDLGPQITAKMLNIPQTDLLRLYVMVLVTLLCVLPLGLLKNVDSLATVSTASIGFYLCLVLKVIAEAKAPFLMGEWRSVVLLWQPSGVMQCLPIFSMALGCQMQLFEVIETMPGVSLEKMNQTVRSATAMCCIVYIFVGFFGYVAFCTQDFAGNILLNFSATLISDVIKIGFVISVACSFPLVIFPCRASLYSLLYRKDHIDAVNYIPELKFRMLTVVIVIICLIIGILIPSIELVIGLIGSTMGVSICVIFPALCFKRVAKKDSTEKSAAKFMCVFGFVLMILGTYANLSAIDEKKSGPMSNDDLDMMNAKEEVVQMPNVKVPDLKLPESAKVDEEKITEKVKPPDIVHEVKESAVIGETGGAAKEVVKSDAKEKERNLDADAILKEDHEIAVEDSADAKKHDHEFHAVVNEIQRQNKEMMEKLEQIAGKIDSEKSSKENIAPEKLKESSLKLQAPKADDHAVDQQKPIEGEMKAQEPVKIAPPDVGSREKLIQNITSKFPNPIPIALLPNASLKHDEALGRPNMPKNGTVDVVAGVPQKPVEVPKLVDTIKATIETPVETPVRKEEKPNVSKEEVKVKDQVESSKENVDTIRRDLLGVHPPPTREKRNSENVDDRECERDPEQL
ncbi:putative sodium-coupled neutral amino acid transporter 10 [Phlebotomus argentipes]|uniref:putative sodium-coupled neutral amino acid transporter 10 n=1 Tax=Phlebotomus argentipes TaxID=94469 RepID=UPI0028937F82|nr:putative sodium-coupled neutral amino acid transporter 10 [Phlebotomus argentipes]